MIFIRKLYLTLVFVLTLSISYGQLNIDSIKVVLSKTASDTSSINSVINQGMKVRKINLDASLIYFQWALQQSLLTNSKYFQSKAYFYLGSTHNLMNEAGNAAANLVEGLRLAEEIGNKPLILKCYVGLGNMYSYNQQTKPARGMYLKALKLAEELDNQFDKATIFNNLGALTYRESELIPAKMQLAVSYFLKSVSIIESTGNSSELIYKYNNLGLIYCDLEKPDSALLFLEKSKKIIDLNKNPDDLINYYNYLGRVYVSKKDYEKAETAYQYSLEEAKKLNDAEWVYESYLSISGLFESKGDFKQAFHFYRMYSTLKDSVKNASNFEVASDIKNKFEREKKEVELNQLKTEQSKQKIFNIALILVSILTVISGIMMYSRFKIKSVSEAKLKIQNDIITQKNKDITDSINYARKIQQSVLPQEKYIEKEIKKLKG